MTKYYRVRTQEQWDWLMKWFEEQSENILWTGDILPAKVANPYNDDKCVVSLENNKLMHGDVRYFKRSENITDFIEVSQMMEESKMEDYVTIKGEDLKNVEMFRGDELKGNLREFWDVNKVNIPKSLLYPKVRMSVVEKKEFDELKKQGNTLYTALDNMSCDGDLYIRFFGTTDLNAKQLEFARAWADESLIEVIPEKKFNVKVPFIDDEFYYKKDDGGLYHAPVAHNHENNQQFTAEEIKHYHLDNDLFEKVEVSE